jgi:hypothetical protein
MVQINRQFTPFTNKKSRLPDIYKNMERVEWRVVSVECEW